MFPNDAKTFFGQFTSSTTQVFESAGDYTILSINSQITNTNSPINIRCGNELIYTNRLAGSNFLLLSKECENKTLVFQKTNNNFGSVNITYVPYLMSEATTTVASSSVGYNPPTDIASSSDVQFYGSISAGEFIISIFILIGLVLYLMNLLSQALSGIRTERKFMRYSGGDVPIDHD